MPTDLRQTSVALILEAGQEKTEVTGRIGFGVRDFLMDLKFQAPLGTGQDEATVATLSGLSNDAIADFGFAWLHWRANPPSGQRLVEAFEVCKEYWAARGEEAQQVCTAQMLPRGAWRNRFYDYFDFSDTALSVGARVKAGRKEFDYLETETLEAQTVSHNVWGVTSFLGVYSTQIGLIGANYQYEQFWKAAGKAREICQPLDGSVGVLACRDAVVGEPTKKAQSIVQLEWRRFLVGSRLAINPSISQELTEGVTGIDVPFYFLKSGDGGLNGGVRVGWRSDTDAISVSLFVGAALDLIRS